MGKKRICARAGFAIICLAASGAIHAAERFWVTPTGGVFGAPGGISPSWSTTAGGAGGATVPGAADIANFTLNNTYDISFGTSLTNQALDIENGNVTLDLDTFHIYTLTNATAVRIGNVAGQTGRLTLLNGNLNVDTAGDNVEIGEVDGATGFFTVGNMGRLGTAALRPDIIVANSGTGTFTIQSNAAVMANTLSLGSAIGSAGTMSIAGPQASLSVDGTGNVIVGNSGNGTMTVSAGATTTALATFIGIGSGSAGTLTVTGAGSQWVQSAGIKIADEGVGTLNIQSGASFSNQTLTMGERVGSLGTVNVTGAGSNWIISSVGTVGQSGRGNIVVSSGGHVTSASAMSLGQNVGSEGEITVTGAGSRLNLNFNLGVGFSGVGSLSVLSGGAVNVTGTVELSRNLTGQGMVTISGAGSTLTADAIFLGGSATSGSTALATMNIEGGGVVQNGAETKIYAGSTLNLNGGFIYTGRFTRLGDFNFSDGLLEVTSDFDNGTTPRQLVIDGSTPGALPTLTLSRFGFMSDLTTLTVGHTHRAALNILTGRNINLGGNNISLGFNPTGDGSITLNGNGSALTTSGTIAVGGNGISPGGTGLLTIGSGSTVNAGMLNLFAGGTINLNGGTLSVGTLTDLGGAFNWSSGALEFSNTASISTPLLDMILGPGHLLNASHMLRATNGPILILNSDLTVNGGSISGSTFVNNNLLILRQGSVAPGSLGFTNSTGATLLVEGTGVLSSSLPILNNGTMHLASITSSITGTGTLTNNGVIGGTGSILNPVQNNDGGQIQATTGSRLVFGSTLSNSGVISLVGGEIQFGGAVTNNASTGVILARDAILRFNGGLTNSGLLNMSFGTSDIFGQLSNASSGKMIVSGNSNATFNDAITNPAGGELRVSTGSTAVFFGAVNNAGLISGGGTKIFEGGGSGLGGVATPGSTIVEAAASVTATFIREDSLTVNGRLTINTSGAASHLNQLNIAGDGVLDFKNNSLVLEGGDLTLITSQIRSGLYQGTGIISSAPGVPFRLGSMSNSGPIYTTFQGISGLDGDEVLIRYTRIGDLNLDGTVTISDFIDLASNFNRLGGATWQMGDVNYDGSVTISDFIDLASNFNQSVSGDALPTSDADASMLAEFATANGASAVPEPSCLLLMPAIAGLTFRRIRKLPLARLDDRGVP
jgi:fibronectin-binding autotransporter adhesin